MTAIGGSNSSDPSPTLAQFEQYVANGEVHYFIAGGGRMVGGPGGAAGGGPGAAGSSTTGSSSSAIAAWVSAHFEARTVDGVTLYDLSLGVR